MAPQNTHKNHKTGFTLIEIMMVLLIVGILVGLAMPNFLRAREVARASSCVKNLSTIAIAKEQYAMEHQIGPRGAIPDLSVLVGSGSTAYIKIKPVCNAGGEYTVNNLGTEPVCSLGSTGAGLPHILP